MTRRRERDGSNARVPPHSDDAEAALLGAAMLAPAALEVLAKQTRPEDFYRPAHQFVAAVLHEAYEGGWSPDPVSVADALRRDGLLDDIGGPATLLSLQTNTPSTSNASQFADIVHDYATMRRLIAAGAEIGEIGYGTPDDVHEAVLKAQTAVGGVAANNGARAYSSLVFGDVKAMVAGELQLEESDFLRRTDGLALFYSGKMNGLQGEPSGGKTWIALLTAVEILAMGGAVLYLDYEDSLRAIVGRLLALGADPSAVASGFCYVRPEGAWGTPERVEAEKKLAELNPDLVVIDGVGEALVRDGLSEDNNAEVIAWIERVPRWFARTGAAVMMLDHIPKPQQGQGHTRYARGASAKLGAVDGAVYRVETSTPFSRHRSGAIKLYIAKDKPGAVGELGSVAAVAKVEPAGAGEVVRITVEPPAPPKAEGDAWKPTQIMERISKTLEESREHITRDVLGLLLASVKPTLLREALGALMREGYVTQVPHGKGKALRLVREYREDGDPGPIEPGPEQQGFSDAELFAEEAAEAQRYRDELAERRAEAEQGEEQPE